MFELVRHGARAPEIADDKDKFSIFPGMLTQEGMRQRYLLGKFNRERYINQYKLLDENYNPDQLHIVSTDVFRTIQSSYSELLGLYPPSFST